MKHTKQNGKYPIHTGIPLNPHKEYHEAWRLTINLVTLTMQSKTNSTEYVTDSNINRIQTEKSSPLITKYRHNISAM
jgi:hypothetical protein